jgi:CelD/BcsL family acetyltransferase involved in cellulose biosynthesis
MQVLLSRPGELGPDEIAAWQSMQRATPSLANPFLSPEFAIAVGQFRPAARVAVLYDGPSLVGFFPFETGKLGAGMPICAWPGALCQGLIHAPGLEWDPQDLLRGCRLSVWQFDHLVAGQKPFECYQVSTTPSPVMDLSNGFASYLAQLKASSPASYNNLARKGRNLVRDAGEYRMVTDSRDTNLMRTLMNWKSKQYHNIGAIDRFDRPWFVGLLDALHAVHNEHISGLLCVSFAGDEPIAAQFGMCSGGIFAPWFTSYNPRFSKYSPGMLQFLRSAEQLAAAGVHTIDFGEGAASYKETIKSRDIFVAEGIVSRRSVLAMAHRAHSTSTQWAGRTLFKHPRLYRVTRRIRKALR